MITHDKIFLAGILILAIGLPFSNFLMSISQILLISNWLIEGNLKRKWQLFTANKTALVLSGLLLLHILGLAYTQDWVYGLNDVKKKLPLLLLPLVFSSSKKFGIDKMHLVLKVFIAAVFVATLYSTIILIGLTPHEITDVRQISTFISHIRFSLMISFSTLLCAYFMKMGKGKMFFGIAILWFVVFLMLMESLTGLLTLSAGVFLLLARGLLHQKNIALKRIGLTALVLSLLLPITYLAWEVNAFYSFTPLKPGELEKFTSRGEPYYHEYDSKEVENGNFVRIYIARDELKEAWNTRSEIDFEDRDRKGHFLEYTIYRFLTSKGLRKDADGLGTLSDAEVDAIENGIANVDYQDRTSLRDRIRQVIWEVDWYFKSYNPTGHSLTMRLEFWKVATGIIKENFFFGIGTGDAPAAFEKGYINSNTQLGRDYWHRSHNQFLAIAVAFGFFGLAYFLFSLLFPFFSTPNSKSYFYLTFFIIAILSMLTEDTLETQAGVSFFAFFSAFLLFLPKEAAPCKA